MEDQSSALPVNRLIVAIIQEQDAEAIIIKLRQLGTCTNRLPSVGGLLGQRSVTLVIGINQSQEKDLFQTIIQTCRSRIEYVTLPIEGTPIPMPSPTPITVGGATIFSFDVERFEEF